MLKYLNNYVHVNTRKVIERDAREKAQKIQPNEKIECRGAKTDQEAECKEGREHRRAEKQPFRWNHRTT